MATEPEWRSTAMGDPEIGYSGTEVEVRQADGTVEVGVLDYELEMWWFSLANGSSSTLTCFEDWRPYEEDRT